MNEFLMLMKAAFAAAICIRLFFYRWPHDSRYRIGVTFVAYLLMLCSGAVAILLAIGNQGAAQIFDGGIYASILIMVLAARGNLAKILEIRHG